MPNNQSSLGPAFWGNFVRLDAAKDGKHGEEKLHETLEATGLQLALQPKGGEIITLDELHGLQARRRTALTVHGFCSSLSRSTLILMRTKEMQMECSVRRGPQTGAEKWTEKRTGKRKR